MGLSRNTRGRRCRASGLIPPGSGIVNVKTVAPVPRTPRTPRTPPDEVRPERQRRAELGRADLGGAQAPDGEVGAVERLGLRVDEVLGQPSGPPAVAPGVSVGASREAVGSEYPAGGGRR